MCVGFSGSYSTDGSGSFATSRVSAVTTSSLMLINRFPDWFCAPCVARPSAPRPARAAGARGNAPPPAQAKLSFDPASQGAGISGSQMSRRVIALVKARTI
jgi:hypothetical protein